GHRDRAHVRQRGVRAVRERRPGSRGAPAPGGGVLMLHAVVSDVHANLEALETVLADVAARRADDMVCLGDFVGYGASPNDCVALLRPRIQAAVLGNHDQAALDPSILEYFNRDAAAAARWTADALTREHADYLRALPFSVAWQGARLVHASPREPEEWNYVFTPAEALEEMSHR